MGKCLAICFLGFFLDFNINVFVLNLPLMLKLLNIPVLLHEGFYFLEKEMVENAVHIIALATESRIFYCFLNFIAFQISVSEDNNNARLFLLTPGQVLCQACYIYDLSHSCQGL